MRTLTASLTIFLLVLTSSLYTQNDFKLGFTGAYPHNYNNPVTLQHDWGWYNDLNMNSWSGWWMGGNWGTSASGTQSVLSKFASYDINGYLQPDTIRWAGYGRVQVNEAELDDDLRFRYGNHHSIGRNIEETWQGTIQKVRFYEVIPTESPALVPVLTEVKENCFQSIANFPYDPMYQVDFPFNENQNDPDDPRSTKYYNKYYVMPRMRISTSDITTNKPVIKIIVKAFDGVTTVLEKDIFTFDFKNNGTYDGNYKEDFPGLNLSIFGDLINTGRGEVFVPTPDVLANCHVDYQIYWYGEVNVWIDYVKVMDEAAYMLFNEGQDGIRLRNAIQQKINFIKTNEQEDRMKGFYMEEVDYSNIACLKYLNDSLPVWANDPDYKMMPLINWISFRGPLREGRATDYADFMDAVRPNAVMYVAYPFEGPHGPHPPKLPISISYFFQSYYPSEISTQITTAYDSYKTGPDQYNTYLQNQCWDFYDRRFDTINSLCRTRGIEFYLTPQVHTWKDPGLIIEQSHREPMNSELSALFNIGICHGIKGIMPYAYESGYSFRQPRPRGGNGVIENAVIPQTGDGYSYSFGMTDFDDSNHWGIHKRERNFYGEYKWQFVQEHFAKIKTWEDIIINSSNTEGYSVSLEGSNHEYIENFVSIVPHLSGQNPCVTDGPGLGEFADCPEESYWEMGFFGGERNNCYFMLVNRRCVPEDASHFTQDNRFVKIKFNGTNLPGSWKNWQLSEVGGSTRPINFSRNGGYLDLGNTAGSMGWFKPGEGKMFKITPTSETGGELVCDEVITGESFTCEDTIFSNGYNITIGAGTNIKFTDSSCIVMNGGVFTMGDQQVSGSQNITFDAASGSSWRGHSFTGTEVHIYGASFTGLANDSVYALNMVDCPVVDIRNTTFNTAGTLKGGINAVYYANEESATVNLYIGGNTFTATGSTIPTINVSSFAGTTTPLIIENNTFTNGNTSVFLSGITGGAVKSNVITDNYTGISLLSSYVDISGNTISSTVNGSTGIFAAGGSEIKMNSAGSKELGGMNNISNEGTGTNNIKVESSYFLTDGGQNVFNISDISTSYHLYGYFPQYIAIPYDETMNCFKISGSPTNTPYNLVTDGYQGSQITFNFYPLLTGCDPEQGDNMMVLDLGNGINDTIYSNGLGLGGSESSINNKQLTISNKNQKRVYVQNVNTAYDSICMLMRSRNYSAARTKCIEMISNYPDSIQSLNALAKLYLASVSSNADIADLKVFYENLILNHPNNTSLVKRANYYTLKCKVRLHEYASALAGFQQIINENPYSYEGLIAKWDYMATSLLVPQAGSFGSEPTVSVLDENSSVSIDIVNALQKEADLPKSEIHNPNSSDDKSPFTKEQRIDIRKSINSAFENDKNENDRKLRILETRSDQGDVNAIKELAQVKALKQVVKTERPGSITEHIRLVSEDIQKVFGNVTGGKGKDMSNIPTVYRLSQNYPNPFNPVTNIKYQIPNNKTIVKIAVYDILGREVLTLVNNVQDAGEYKIDFNASNYASGVYFYRIEAEEPGGNKFVDSKKMVLIK